MSIRWFDYVFTYAGDNRSLMGFFNAIELIMETGFAVTAFMAVILNLIIRIIIIPFNQFWLI